MDIEKLEKLEKLNELREKGIITEEEYNKIRDKTLSLFVKEHKVKNINKRKSLWEYYSSCVNEKYKTISGRASRKEYIGFNLFFCIFFPMAYIFICFLSFFITDVVRSLLSFDDFFIKNENLYMFIVNIFAFLFLFRPFILPSICVHIRRLHDLGYSGVFAAFPFLYGVLLIFNVFERLKFPVLELFIFGILSIVCWGTSLYCIFVKGDDGLNKYGSFEE